MADESKHEDPSSSQMGNSGAMQDEVDYYIKLKVICADVEEVYFKVNSETELVELMRFYVERISLPVGTLRFMYDGERINAGETARLLGMDDEDCIEVFQEQVGGYVDLFIRE
ncbi:hypothetical protein ACOME3_009567 [Neoechinorhynchus agilis]